MGDVNTRASGEVRSKSSGELAEAHHGRVRPLPARADALQDAERVAAHLEDESPSKIHLIEITLCDRFECTLDAGYVRLGRFWRLE
jgi:hypothetical protein